MIEIGEESRQSCGVNILFAVICHHPCLIQFCPYSQLLAANCCPRNAPLSLLIDKCRPDFFVERLLSNFTMAPRDELLMIVDLTASMIRAGVGVHDLIRRPTVVSSHDFDLLLGTDPPPEHRNALHGPELGRALSLPIHQRTSSLVQS